MGNQPYEEMGYERSSTWTRNMSKSKCIKDILKELSTVYGRLFDSQFDEIDPIYILETWEKALSRYSETDCRAALEILSSSQNFRQYPPTVYQFAALAQQAKKTTQGVFAPPPHTPAKPGMCWAKAQENYKKMTLEEKKQYTHPSLWKRLEEVHNEEHNL